MRCTLWLLLGIASFVHAAEELPWTRLDIPGVEISGTGKIHAGLWFEGDFGWWNTGGQLWVTHDAGRSWTLSPSLPQNHTFYDSYFVDTLRGWIASAGETTELLHTRDGGITWQPLAMKLTQTSNQPVDPARLFLTRIYFKDAQNGLGIFAISKFPYETESILARTEDGGWHWTEIHRSGPFPEITGFGDQIWMSKSYTPDFGETFQTISTPNDELLPVFVTPLYGWIVSYRHVGEGASAPIRWDVLKTTDGGQMWSDPIFSGMVSSGLFGGIEDLLLLSEDIGMFLGSSSSKAGIPSLLYLTENGGTLWLSYEVPTQSDYQLSYQPEHHEIWLVPSVFAEETTLFYTPIPSPKTGVALVSDLS